MASIWQDLLLTLLSLLASVIVVLLIVVTGWFLVWKLFLSRFKFVQELLNGSAKEKAETADDQPRQSGYRLRSRTRAMREQQSSS
ncbi:SMIM13 [Branchiostoma lanceolatum]|uniref:SMIM13 protein n=1 Tax=Branchiostoma lanceolatum TaxID=7740 RepID=A0A8K0A592_BRALA|nr:SMIM13 [Branchiostoma lanceolatum]